MAKDKETKIEKGSLNIPDENIKVLIALSDSLLKQVNKKKDWEEEIEKVKGAGGFVEKDEKTGKYKIVPNNLLNQELKDKKVAKISARWNIAYQSSLERDKQILSLSALTIGGLLIFLQAGFRTELSFIFWAIAIFSFLISVILSLEILRNNSIRLSIFLNQKESFERLCNKCKDNTNLEAIEEIYQIHDNIEKWTYRLFLLGVSFTILFALYQSGITLKLPETNTQAKQIIETK